MRGKGEGYSGRYVGVGVNKYRIDKEDGDNGDDGDRNEGGQDVTEALKIDNSAVRESHIQRIGDLRAKIEKNEAREALDCLKRSAALYKDD